MLALLEIFYSDSSSGSIWHGTFKIQNTFPLLDKVKNIFMSVLKTGDLLSKSIGIIFSNNEKNICCGYSAEASQRHSIEYSQLGVLWRTDETLFVKLIILTLVLLNPDMTCLCKQCRSRSVEEAN